MPPTFWTAVIGTIVGALVGGGGATYVARLALTERLRSTFAAREQTVEKVDLEKALGQLQVGFRTEMTSVIGSAELRITREYERLRADLDRAIGAMERVADEARKDGRIAIEAMGEAKRARERAEALAELVGEYNRRLSHVDEQLGQIRQEIATLKVGT